MGGVTGLQKKHTGAAAMAQQLKHCGSSRGPGFGSQHQCGSSQPSGLQMARQLVMDQFSHGFVWVGRSGSKVDYSHAHTGTGTWPSSPSIGASSWDYLSVFTSCQAATSLEQSGDSDRKYFLVPSDSSHTPSVLSVRVNRILPNPSFQGGTAPALLI